MKGNMDTLTYRGSHVGWTQARDDREENVRWILENKGFTPSRKLKELLEMGFDDLEIFEIALNFQEVSQ
jgi:hypothetical protein